MVYQYIILQSADTKSVTFSFPLLLIHVFGCVFTAFMLHVRILFVTRAEIHCLET